MGTHPIFESDFDCLTETGYKNAKTNPRDQGIPFHCSPKGCLLCQNQEEQGEHQIQGSMLKVPLLFGCQGYQKKGINKLLRSLSVFCSIQIVESWKLFE